MLSVCKLPLVSICFPFGRNTSKQTDPCKRSQIHSIIVYTFFTAQFYLFPGEESDAVSTVNVPQSTGVIAGACRHILTIGMKLCHLM